MAAGCRIVPGCGVAPGLTNILARLGADRLDPVDAIRLYSYITHPMWTSPGIVVTRFDASTGTSLVFERGAWWSTRRSAEAEEIVFPEPYGEQEVHLVPHPEPVTLPRSIDVRERRLQGRLSGGRDATDQGPPRARLRRRRAVRARRRRDLAAPVRRGRIDRQPRDRADRPQCQRQAGPCLGRPRRRDVSLVYDFAVEQVGRSASSAITGTVAAIAADLVARGGPAGVHPPESAFDPRAFLDALAERGFVIEERELDPASGPSPGRRPLVLEGRTNAVS